MNTDLQKRFANHYFVIRDLGSNILMRMASFRKIVDDAKLRHDFPDISFVYMHQILLDISKFMSLSGADNSGFPELIHISPKDIQAKIKAVESTYEPLLKKVESNRNRTIAHIDISNAKSYMKMGFSEAEITKKIDDYTRSLTGPYGDAEYNHKLVEDLLAMRSSSSDEERYSPSDFLNDSTPITLMIEECFKIADELNQYYYNQSA